MLISSRISFDSHLVGLSATSNLIVGLADPTVTLTGSSSITATAAEYTFGSTVLPSFESLGGDVELAGYGSGNTVLAALQSESTGGLFVPTTLDEGNAFLPSLYSGGLILVTDHGDGDTSLPSLESVGGEGNYGFGSVTLQPFESYGAQGTGNLTGEIWSIGYFISSAEGLPDAIVFINSTGQIVDTITGTRELIVSLLGTITATDEYTLIGNYLVGIEAEITGAFFSAPTVGDVPALDSTARVWVVNIDTGASGQYENYGYNSYLERDGVSYGLAENGIFRLDGDTDNGTEIDALIDYGRINLGTQKKKLTLKVYAAVGSDGKMYLKVDADEQVYYYEARSSSIAIKNHRFDIGRGLRGNYFNFTLMNQDGADFDLETLTFKPVILSRKI